MRVVHESIYDEYLFTTSPSELYAKGIMKKRELERENSSRGPKLMDDKECDEEEHQKRVKVTDYL